MLFNVSQNDSDKKMRKTGTGIRLVSEPSPASSITSSQGSYAQVSIAI